MSGPKGLFAGLFKPSSGKVAKSRALLIAPAPSKKTKTRRKSRVRSGASRLWRGVLVGLGSFLVVLGIVIAPLPGPMGMPVSIAGLIVVLRNSYWAKRQFIRTWRRHPKWLTPVRRLLRPRAKILSIVWHQMLRTEKLVLKTKDRILGPVRRRFLRKARRHTFHTQSAK
ncbi:hypothetical protein [Asticcacaulis sp. AND118]|uniref:hypothetical protein n=1 Tax=Asticcacaulis sp. AND118 TaxID=2840468 RepID=UPI001CFFCB2A|nr:hypothetical protein [Asticcacaulis sp. AND118]UDF04446.1 hypothetical protein LH365_05255 [Asticcacaulis sp. AND118]